MQYYADAELYKQIPNHVEGLFEWAADAFMTANAGNSISKNIEKLVKGTYPAVIKANGLYPVKSLR
jgi:hypothetical protein